MKIVIDRAIPFIENRVKGSNEILFIPGKDITKEVVKDADALIVRTRTSCNEELLKDSKVKLVATATIGTDHIDSEWCEKNGIEVKNAPGCNAPGVAQYVFASLFRAGFNPGKDTLGIIGYGNVGSIVAEWAKIMGIKTLISDLPRERSGFNDVEYLSKEYVLQNSNAVTLHVPLTYGEDFMPSGYKGKKNLYPTYHLIGSKELACMPSGSIIVNTSRGGVVDEKSLKYFLKEGKLKAIIDVWENEPYIDRELAESALISTPHIAGYSEEGKKRASMMVLKELTNILNIETDIRGLECLPPEGSAISGELIFRSYDPLVDKANLIAHIDSFEDLRNNYQYRHEPLFSATL